jgi:hypothetical protein
MWKTNFLILGDETVVYQYYSRMIAKVTQVMFYVAFFAEDLHGYNQASCKTHR